MIENITKSVQNKFIKNESVKSMGVFLEDLKKEPYKYCRNSAEYVRDVFNYFGSYPVSSISGESILRWQVFDGNRHVEGQEEAQNEIYKHLCSFADNRINKLILLHGPNGSAKTSIVAAIMEAVEKYSQLPEGASYTFNWIFSDRADKSSLGFKEEESSSLDNDSLAYIKPEDVTFKLICDMKDNPLLLLPKEERRVFLEELLGKGKAPRHILDAELCQKCQEIYNQLQISYEGNWSKIIKHIQVERFYFSKRFRKGLVSIEPTTASVDAHSRPLNLEKNYKIPPILSLSSISEPFGDLVDANRGIAELSEIFKRHEETNKYLLTTAEWGTLSLPGIMAYLDCIFFATGNEAQLSMFKQDMDWPAFNGRFAYVKVPYLLQYSKEREIYKETIKSLSKSKHISPHTETIIALWAVLTRLRKSKLHNAKSLNLIQKATLYDQKLAPENWKEEARRSLMAELPEIATEFEEIKEKLDGITPGNLRDSGYEGRRGASPREVLSIISSAIHNKNFSCLSPLAIFKAIEDIIKDKTIYEFLRLPETEYSDPEKLLREVKKLYTRWVQKDIRDSSGLISEDEYQKLFDKYISNVRAWSRGEKIFNSQTQTHESPDEITMDNVETLVGAEDKTEYRKNLLSKVATWALNNPDKPIDFQTIFSDIFETIKTNSVQKRLEQIRRLQKGILYYETEDWKLVSTEDQQIVVTTVDNMKKLGYTDECLKEAVVFVIKSQEEVKQSSLNI